jgi:hypothetical protein
MRPCEHPSLNKACLVPSRLFYPNVGSAFRNIVVFTTSISDACPVDRWSSGTHQTDPNNDDYSNCPLARVLVKVVASGLDTRGDVMWTPVLDRIFLRVAALTMTLPFFAINLEAQAQSVPQKYQGKIVCGAFSGDPKLYPAWNDSMEITINRGTLLAVPSRTQGQTMTGVVAASGSVLVAGEGGLPGKPPEWTYEFSGQLNSKGATVLRGQLANIMGGGAKRSCALTF